MELTDILRSPKTGGRLRFDEAALLVRGEHSETTYPVVDGIVDFCSEARDKISDSYDRIAPRYDSYITASSVFMRVVNKVIWACRDDRDHMGEVLSLLPASFDGVLLDVPVGTGVFTAPFFSRYPKATIVGVDYSMGMLRKAQARFREHGLSNVHLLRADAGNLPLRDAVADIVLSMNGWHAFAEKQRTTAEIGRVLRKGGTFVGCGYVKGARWLSDWFIRHFGVRKGFFTPPFFTADELAERFPGFQIVRRQSDKSIAWLEAVNAEASSVPEA